MSFFREVTRDWLQRLEDLITGLRTDVDGLVAGSGGTVSTLGGTSTDNAVTRYNGTGGTSIQNSLVTIGDTGNVALPALATVDGRDVSVDGSTLDTLGTTVSTLSGVALKTNASAQVSGLSAKTALVGADVLLIEDSAASFAKKKTTFASIGNSLYSARDSIWDPPSSPSADDDEFTVDTLASGAWTTSFTRDGAVDMTATVATGHYRSSVIGSTLFLQVLKTDNFTMHKTVAGALSTDQLWFMAYGGIGDYPSSQPLVTFGLYKNSAGSIDFNNESIVRAANSNFRIESVAKVASVTNSNNVGSQFDAGVTGFDGLYLRVNHGSAAANNAYGGAWKRNGLYTGHLAGLNGPQFNASTDRVAMSVFTSPHTQDPQTGVGQSLIAFHMMRRMNTNSVWFAQA